MPSNSCVSWAFFCSPSDNIGYAEGVRGLAAHEHRYHLQMLKMRQNSDSNDVWHQSHRQEICPHKPLVSLEDSVHPLSGCEPTGSPNTTRVLQPVQLELWGVQQVSAIVLFLVSLFFFFVSFIHSWKDQVHCIGVVIQIIENTPQQHPKGFTECMFYDFSPVNLLGWFQGDQILLDPLYADVKKEKKNAKMSKNRAKASDFKAENGTLRMRLVFFLRSLQSLFFCFWPIPTDTWSSYALWPDNDVINTWWGAPVDSTYRLLLLLLEHVMYTSESHLAKQRAIAQPSEPFGFKNHQQSETSFPVSQVRNSERCVSVDGQSWSVTPDEGGPSTVCNCSTDTLCLRVWAFLLLLLANFLFIVMTQLWLNRHNWDWGH